MEVFVVPAVAITAVIVIVAMTYKSIKIITSGRRK
jgi:hypothetical protein